MTDGSAATHDSGQGRAFTVTVERGDRRRTFTGPELARLLGGPAICVRLKALLFAPGGKGGPSLIEGTNVRDVEEEDTEQRNVRESGATVADGGDAFAGSTLRLAAYLADRLGDFKSIAFYRRVTASVPREVIRDALVAALDLAPSEVRRSRAAYFTAIVRPYMTAGGRPAGTAAPGANAHAPNPSPT